MLLLFWPTKNYEHNKDEGEKSTAPINLNRRKTKNKQSNGRKSKVNH